jgi:chaperonin GroEL (HSP60 family)
MFLAGLSNGIRRHDPVDRREIQVLHLPIKKLPITNKFSKSIDITNDKELIDVVKSSLGTKMMAKYMDMAVDIALKAVRTIKVDSNDYSEIDIKRYCRIEKIPGGAIEESKVVKGVVLNKVCNNYFSKDKNKNSIGCCSSKDESKD